MYAKCICNNCSLFKNVSTNIIQNSTHLGKRIEKKFLFLQMLIGIVKAVRMFLLCN